MFVNPLDKVPQIPQDWGNHIAYGGALGVAALLLLVAAGVGISPAVVIAALFVLAAAAVKKTVDFFLEGESLEVCVGKAVVTAVWPATLVLVLELLRLAGT